MAPSCDETPVCLVGSRQLSITEHDGLHLLVANGCERRRNDGKRKDGNTFLLEHVTIKTSNAISSSNDKKNCDGDEDTTKVEAVETESDNLEKLSMEALFTVANETRRSEPRVV